MSAKIFENLPVADQPRAKAFYAALGFANGGTPDVNPPEDHGFMFQRTIADPDGHIWEPFWMDAAFAAGDPQPKEAGQ